MSIGGARVSFCFMLQDGLAQPWNVAHWLWT